MKKRTPKKNSFISMGMIAFGSILLLIGAKISQDYKINHWEILGFIIIVCGIICYLVTVRCPYCGQSLAGYRPFPEECPHCHKPLDR